MRSLFFKLCLVMGMAVSATLAQQPAQQPLSSAASLKMSASERAVWGQEEAYWRFVKTHDKQGFLKLWDERFAGWPYTQHAPVHKDAAGALFSGRKYLDYKLEPLSVREYDKNIVITFYRATLYSTDAKGTDEPTRASRLTHTWVKVADGWHIVGGMSCEENPGPQASTSPVAPGGNSLVSASAPARANADPQAERELRAAYDEIHTAILKHDPAVIEKYYGPDYVMTFSDGPRGNFENSLHVLSDENRNKWHSHDVSNEKFLFYGDTAIATLTVHSRWFGRGREHDVREHLTQTWVRRAARWTLVATQATLIDPSQE